MSQRTLRHLWEALDFSLSEVLRLDFVVGLVGGGAAVWLALSRPAALQPVAGVAVGVVGVIIGAVIAGLSVQAAFLDQAFLRKVVAIGRDPVRYLAPFLFTAVIGVLAMLLLITLASLTPSVNKAVLGTVAGLTGFFTVWTVVSLLPGLATLIQFVGLKVDALDVPDDIGTSERDGHDRAAAHRT